MRFTIPPQISVFQCLLKTPSRPRQFQVYPRKLFWLRHTWHGCQNLGTAYEFSTRPLQEVEKICRTLQSHVMQVWTMTFWLLAPDPDKAEPLPVLSNKLPFFLTDALAQIA